MRIFTLRRLAGTVAVAMAAMTAAAGPASALSLAVDDTSLIHVEDCRSAAIDRTASYGFDFSSNTTGPLHVGVALAADASIDLCWSLDVTSLNSVEANVETWEETTTVIDDLLNESDATLFCAEITLTVAPDVRGTVTATSHAHVLVDGAPPADWDHTFADDLVVDSLGETITLRTCADTSGNVSAS